ncbi:MAG: hypothetical protein WC565_03230 [Parcubacteria group bacterium]|jgi:predicted RNase H-like nuclease (RuvC/YqgF family)
MAEIIPRDWEPRVAERDELWDRYEKVSRRVSQRDEQIAELEADIAAKDARIAELEEALRPFAVIADLSRDGLPCEGYGFARIGDCRKARATLAWQRFEEDVRRNAVRIAREDTPGVSNE